MCGRCEEGEPYRGVRLLFTGDRHGAGRIGSERADWRVISPDIIVYVGESDMRLDERPLVRDCAESWTYFDPRDRVAVVALAHHLGRPATERDSVQASVN